MTGSKRFLLPLAFASLCATAASADSPSLIGSYKDWSAFQTTVNGSRLCYAMAKPKSSEPKKAARDPAYFMISDWPGRKAKAELEIVPGYQYKDGSSVTAEIGKDKTDFFTKNDGGAGSAWVDEHLFNGRYYAQKLDLGDRSTIEPFDQGLVDRTFVSSIGMIVNERQLGVAPAPLEQVGVGGAERVDHRAERPRRALVARRFDCVGQRVQFRASAGPRVRSRAAGGGARRFAPRRSPRRGPRPFCRPAIAGRCRSGPASQSAR